MSLVKELKKEFKEKKNEENHCKSRTILLQATWVKEHPICVECGNTTNLTYDHIIPVQILRNFNIDPTREFWEENSQTLCHACNQLKQNNLILKNPKTKTLLLGLIN